MQSHYLHGALASPKCPNISHNDSRLLAKSPPSFSTRTPNTASDMESSEHQSNKGEAGSQSISVPPDLPPGLITRFDEQAQAWRFAERATGETLWRPLAEVDGLYPLPELYKDRADFLKVCRCSCNLRYFPLQLGRTDRTYPTAISERYHHVESKGGFQTLNILSV